MLAQVLAALTEEPGLGKRPKKVGREQPLIVGKPAVARIYADWKRHPEVYESAQVEEFLARVSLDSGASDQQSSQHLLYLASAQAGMPIPRLPERGVDSAAPRPRRPP